MCEGARCDQRRGSGPDVLQQRRCGGELQARRPAGVVEEAAEGRGVVIGDPGGARRFERVGAGLGDPAALTTREVVPVIGSGDDGTQRPISRRRRAALHDVHKAQGAAGAVSARAVLHVGERGDDARLLCRGLDLLRWRGALSRGGFGGCRGFWGFRGLRGCRGFCGRRRCIARKGGLDRRVRSRSRVRVGGRVGCHGGRVGRGRVCLGRVGVGRRDRGRRELRRQRETSGAHGRPTREHQCTDQQGREPHARSAARGRHPQGAGVAPPHHPTVSIAHGAHSCRVRTTRAGRASSARRSLPGARSVQCCHAKPRRRRGRGSLVPSRLRALGRRDQRSSEGVAVEVGDESLARYEQIAMAAQRIGSVERMHEARPVPEAPSITRIGW